MLLLMDWSHPSNAAVLPTLLQELKERMYVFQFLTSESDGGGGSAPSKEEYLRQLCRNIANTMYRPDPVSAAFKSVLCYVCPTNQIESSTGHIVN